MDRIKYQEDEYVYSDVDKDYQKKDGRMLLGNIKINYCFNENVEILEKDKPIIEKIDTTTENTLFTMECFTGIPEKAEDWNFNILKNTLNQIIDYINRKEDK